MSRKDKRVFVALTENDFQLWKAYANKKEISLPEFIRRGVNVYIKMLEKWEKNIKNK